MTSLKHKKDDKVDSLYSVAGGAMARRVSFAAGTPIFSRKDSRDCAYIIDQGEVEINDTKEGTSGCKLGPGEIFGEMALIDSGPRTATAVALKDTDAFVIPRRVMESRLAGLDPLISLFMALLIDRYRVTRIHMPESIRQESSGGLLDKLQRITGLSPKTENILDAKKQGEIAMQELKMEQELRAALMNKEFVPFLQPILDLSLRKPVGFEALIRWQHPKRGIVGPFEFVPVAERTNVVQLLDAMMLEKACENIPALIKTAGHDIFISVNLSGINFESVDLVGTIGSILQKYGTDPKHIRLEITESALIGDPLQAEDVLKGLKGLGLKIALDDFGTGYSSLSYLHKFSIDTLKIDRAFISNIDTQPKSIDIVRAITGLARTFKQNTVAEGIEREEEVVALTGIGCDMAQGYFFGKPMAVEDAHKYLQKN